MPAGGVADGVAGPRLHHVHDGLDQLAGREVLTGTLWRLLGRLGQQTFVDVALHVRAHRHPVLGVDQVDDQPLEGRRILDLLPSLLEDLPQHPSLFRKLRQDAPVVRLQLLAVASEKACPVESVRYDGRAAPRRLGLLVGHLQEQQEGDLLRVGHVGQAVVTEQVREAPRLVDDLLGVARHHVTRVLGLASRLRGTALSPMPCRLMLGSNALQ